MKKSILISFIIATIAIFPTFGFAANDVNFTQDTNIYLWGTGITLKVISGSKVDEMVVNSNNVQFTLSPGGTLTLRSDDRYQLNNDLNVGINCTDSYSEIVVPGPDSGTRTVTVTPSTSTCASAGTGSSSGGGGGYIPPTPTMPSTDTGEVTVSPSSGGKTTLTTEENSTASVEFPANAVDVSTLVKITAEEKSKIISSKPLPENKDAVGKYIYNFTATADGKKVSSFSKDITLSFTYTEAQVSNFVEVSLRIYYWDEDASRWMLLTTSLNTSSNTLTATVNHFTHYAILGEKKEGEEITISDGDLIRNPNAPGMAQFDVYIVKIVNGKKFKRLILSPHVFESYAHFDKNQNGNPWDDIIDVDEATMNEYKNSQLVRADGDYKIYKLEAEEGSDTGVKHWLNMTTSEFEQQGYDWDSVYIINTTDRDAYTTGSEITIEDRVNNQQEKIMIKADALRVRSLPSLQGEILTLVHKGEIYDVLDEQNKWYKINANGIIGWCFGGETNGYAEKL